MSKLRIPFLPGCFASPSPLFQRLPQGARVFFIRLRNLGEAVLDTANLRALKRFRPDLEITTLVEAIYTDLYAADPEIQAMALPRSAQDRRSSFASRLELIREIRRRRFTAIINLHGGPTSAQFTLLGGARHRVGAAHFRNRYAYNLRIPPIEQSTGKTGLHTVEYQFEQFRWMGLPGEVPEPTHLYVAPAFEKSGMRKLSEAGVDPAQPYIVLAPTNEFYTKRWLPKRYAEVADALIKCGYQIVLTGAPTEEQRAQLQSVVEKSAHPLPALSSLSVGELTAVIARAKLFIGNDSGPAHIAAAVKTPVVVLFGPASSVRWRPWRAPHDLIQNHFDCNPCSMYTCEAFDEPECIRSITVAQVLVGADRLLQETNN